MTIEKVGVLGAGLMGSGIGEVAAKAGVDPARKKRDLRNAPSLRSHPGVPL